MQNGANELRFCEAKGELSVSGNEKVSDITLSGDGSWQKGSLLAQLRCHSYCL